MWGWVYSTTVVAARPAKNSHQYLCKFAGAQSFGPAALILSIQGQGPVSSLALFHLCSSFSVLSLGPNEGRRRRCGSLIFMCKTAKTVIRSVTRAEYVVAW